MKKNRIVLLGVFVFLLSGMAAAQNEDLARLNVSFCTGEVEDTVSYIVDGGEEQEICYILSNGGDSDLNVKVGFIDGVFTNDEWKNRACKLDSQIDDFGQYVTGYEGIAALKAGESMTGTAVVKYPSGTNGIFHGCLAYSILSATVESQGGTSVTIQMRRAKFIDLLVGDLDLMGQGGIIFDDFTEADGENLSSNPKIRLYKDPLDDKYVVAFRLKNIGSFDEEVVVTGVASNVLTYKESFVTERRLIKGENLLLTEKLEEVPLYNLHTKIMLAHTPMLIGDLESNTYTISESAGFLIRNIVTILTVIGIFVLIFIIVLLIKLLNRKPQNKIIKKKKAIKKRK